MSEDGQLGPVQRAVSVEGVRALSRVFDRSKVTRLANQLGLKRASPPLMVSKLRKFGPVERLTTLLELIPLTLDAAGLPPGAVEDLSEAEAEELMDAAQDSWTNRITPLVGSSIAELARLTATIRSADGVRHIALGLVTPEGVEPDPQMEVPEAHWTLGAEESSTRPGEHLSPRDDLKPKQRKARPRVSEPKKISDAEQMAVEFASELAEYLQSHSTPVGLARRVLELSSKVAGASGPVIKRLKALVALEVADYPEAERIGDPLVSYLLANSVRSLREIDAEREWTPPRFPTDDDPLAEAIAGLAKFNRDRRGAQQHLERALEAPGSEQRLAPWPAARFHLAYLRLDAGDRAAALELVTTAESGFRPSRNISARTTELLEGDPTLQARFLKSQLSSAVSIDYPDLDTLSKLAYSGEPLALTEVLRYLDSDPPMSPDHNWDVLRSVLMGSLTAQNAAEREDAIDRVDRFIALHANDPHIENFVELLGRDNTRVRAAFQIDEIYQRLINLNLRLGRPEEAAKAAESLFRVSLDGQHSHLDPFDILETLEELNAGDRAEELRRLLPTPEPEEPAKPETLTRTYKIVFCGGDERQAAMEQAVKEKVRARYGGKVFVEFTFPGWDAGWKDKADGVLSEVSTAEALILMPLVRTNMGRYLRRRAGEMGKPWVSCTGRGVASIVRSIDVAVNVAKRLNETSSS